jgi:hypothetical protein
LTNIISKIDPQRPNLSTSITTRTPIHASISIRNFKPLPPNDWICLAPQSLTPSSTRLHELHRKQLPHTQFLLTNVSTLDFACHWSSTKEERTPATTPAHSDPSYLLIMSAMWTPEAIRQVQEAQQVFMYQGYWYGVKTALASALPLFLFAWIQNNFNYFFTPFFMLFFEGFLGGRRLDCS